MTSFSRGTGTNIALFSTLFNLCPCLALGTLRPQMGHYLWRFCSPRCSMIPRHIRDFMWRCDKCFIRGNGMRYLPLRASASLCLPCGEHRANSFNYQLFQAQLGQEKRYIGSNQCEIKEEFLPIFWCKCDFHTHKDTPRSLWRCISFLDLPQITCLYDILSVK